MHQLGKAQKWGSYPIPENLLSSSGLVPVHAGSLVVEYLRKVLVSTSDLAIPDPPVLSLNWERASISKRYVLLQSLSSRFSVSMEIVVVKLGHLQPYLVNSSY